MALFDQEDDTDYLAELTGPGGKFDRTKYASEEEMYKAIAKGKVHGDRTLDQRNKDFDDLREDFIKAQANATAAEELKRLRTQRSETNDTNPVGNVEQTLDPAKIDELLETKLAARELKRIEQANMDVVEKRLKERFGEKSNSILRDKMKSLGMSEDDLRFLVKRSPEAAINALGLNAQAQESYQGPPSSSMRTDNFAPSTEIRDALYWEKMRREDPKTYFSEKTSIQRLKDMDSPDFLKRYRERST